jgi:hypothetical protein
MMSRFDLRAAAAACLLTATAHAAHAADTDVALPEGYAGPIATVFDSAASLRGNGAHLFFVSSLDGRALDNNLEATRRANHGRGNSMVLMTVARELPATRPLKLVIEAQTAFPAPIVEIFRASQMLSVKRTVTFTPQMNHTYVVLCAAR